MREVIGTDPPGNRNGTPDQEGAESKAAANLATDYPSHEFAATRNRNRQFKDENLIRKYLASRVRYDRWIPPSLRALDRAQRELQHPALAVSISAAEWNWIDLTVWQAYPAGFARSECWKQIGIGLAWTAHLRRKGDRP